MLPPGSLKKLYAQGPTVLLGGGGSFLCARPARRLHLRDPLGARGKRYLRHGLGILLSHAHRNLPGGSALTQSHTFTQFPGAFKHP